MDNKNINFKKILYVVSAVSLIALLGATSYALWTYNFLGNKSALQTGSVSIEFTEGNDGVISVNNAFPMDDSDGMETEPFLFAVTTKAQNDIYLKYAVTIEKLSVTSGYTSLSDNQIKVYLTDDKNKRLVGPSLVSDLENELYSKVNAHSASVNKIKDKYKLRVWIDSNVDALSWTKSTKLEYKFKIGVKTRDYIPLDKSGANAPVLSENMIQVYLDESDGTWRKADVKNENEQYKWYDYDNKVWANSVTVTAANRNTYLNAEPGTIISMNDILTMQVWIPRYKYKIFNYNENGTSYVEPQEIEIVFERGTASTGDIKCVDNIQGTSDGTKTGASPTSSEICTLKSTNAICTDSSCNGKTYTHPAFTFDNEELKGIWVGKFEVTGTINNISTKPDVQSLRSQKLSAFATNIMNMKNTNNIYGFSASDDTHMMKNTEWGAVAYLTQSKYGMCTSGTCKEINFNNSSGYYTGRSGGNVSGSTGVNTAYPEQSITTQYNTYGFYTYDGYLLNYGTNTKSSTRDLTKIASTTGNMSGIYDMSGGTWEDMMANSISFDGRTMMSGPYVSANSGYTGLLYDDEAYNAYTGVYNAPNSKYYDKYSFNTSRTNRRVTKLGDAVKEVGVSSSNNWYGDFGNIVYAGYPWFGRGGGYNNGVVAGIFYSANSHGGAHSSSTARLVFLTSLS